MTINYESKDDEHDGRWGEDDELEGDELEDDKLEDDEFEED